MKESEYAHINEFLAAAERDLGVPLRRPTRPTGTQAIPAVPAPPPPRNRPSVVRLALLLGAAVLIVSLTGQRDANDHDAIPPVALGSWQTTDTRYAGRLLRLTPDSIRLRLGPTGPETAYGIVGVRTQPRSGGLQVSLRYVEHAADDADDDALRFEFIVQQEPLPTLRFLRPENVVWTPVDRPASTGGD